MFLYALNWTDIIDIFSMIRYMFSPACMHYYFHAINRLEIISLIENIFSNWMKKCQDWELKF